MKSPQESNLSEAQQVTRDRDIAMDSPDDWMSDFIGVSQIALTQEAEYLERLGLVDPS
ncbi:MAG: hypothetical protein ACE5IR_23760 [bacterium]